MTCNDCVYHGSSIHIGDCNCSKRISTGCHRECCADKLSLREGERYRPAEECPGFWLPRRDDGR